MKSNDRLHRSHYNCGKIVSCNINNISIISLENNFDQDIYSMIYPGRVVLIERALI